MLSWLESYQGIRTIIQDFINTRGPGPTRIEENHTLIRSKRRIFGGGILDQGNRCSSELGILIIKRYLRG